MKLRSIVKSKNQPPWLLKKRDFIEKKWNQNRDGINLLKRITAVCNLSFPKSVDSIKVTLEPYSRGGGFSGITDAFDKPNEITLFVKKRQRYLDIKLTLCHELVHSLCWCTTRHDQRRVAASLLADTFADELLTTMLEVYIVKGKMTRDDYEWALDYARNDAITKFRNLKRTSNYKYIVDNLESFLTDYQTHIKNGSNFLSQRQRMLKDILSPNDY